MTRFLLILFSLCFLACSNNLKHNQVQTEQTQDRPADTTVYLKPLDENLFPLHNISKSNLLKYLPRSTMDYLDSSIKNPYSLMDSNAINTYIQPVFPDYAVAYFARVKLISWQDKIGDLQPFIVRIDGQDYNGLVYVVLNKYNKPVSKFELTGGPYDVNMDSVWGLHTYTSSTIKGNIINTYKLYMYMWLGDSIERPFRIDSIIYKNTIQPNGEITTIRTDSFRYERKKCPKYIADTYMNYTEE